MTRTLRTIRRSLRAALHAGTALVTAVRGAHYALLVRLYRAIDTRRSVRIRYQDRNGQVSVRDISPRTLRATNTGFITVRAFDHRDGEDTTFRTDRITIAAEENPVTDATVRQIQHRISLDLETPQPLTDVTGRTRKVHAVRIEYGLSAYADRVDVVVEYTDCAQLLPPITPIPDWLQELIDDHKPAAPACTLT